MIKTFTIHNKTTGEISKGLSVICKDCSQTVLVLTYKEVMQKTFFEKIKCPKCKKIILDSLDQLKKRL